MKLETLLPQLRALPKSVQIGAGVVLLAIVLISIVAGVAGHSPRVALFASPLHAEQLTEVEERLAEWSVPFTQSADNILIDANRRNDLLLRLSLAGVPHTHVQTTGEALANVGVLTPQAVIDAQTRSGLAGDIEMGLRSVNGVDDATVIIAPAKTAEFADQSARDASASVRLRLHLGAQLGRDAVAGIRAFVASSVAGLDASHVMILDDRGVALDDASGGGDDSSELQRSLQSALDAAFGGGVAIVRVHADYDRAVSEQRDVRRTPLGNGPIEHTSTNESYNDVGKRYQKRDEHDDRGSETQETTSHTAPGGIVRLSTAVFVDESRAVDLAKVRELAAATVGYDERRGDTIAVQAVDFHRGLAPKHDRFFLLYGALASLLPTLALIIGAIIIIRLAMPTVTTLARQFAERTSIERTSRTVAGFAPAQVRGALAHEPPHAAAAIISALPTATAAAVLELYPPHEREAIVRRMQRPHTSLIPNAEEILGYHA